MQDKHFGGVNVDIAIECIKKSVKNVLKLLYLSIKKLSIQFSVSDTDKLYVKCKMSSDKSDFLKEKVPIEVAIDRAGWSQSITFS